ncbi:MAG: hypothetical protein H7Y42_12360 [Chitinophagaceae bacterium]|nr:hypothetical protein [Chitinophagaceae bacterium]
MVELHFPWTVGSQRRALKVAQPNGGGESYHVYIDKLYQGTLRKLDGRWSAHLNSLSILTTADICVLGDLIDTHFNQT